MTKQITPILIIYHASCPDGFAAALACKLHFKALGYHEKSKSKSISFFAARHGTLPPNCQDKNVYIVDFSYKRKILIDLCQEANKVILIDHHISALKDLENLEQQLDNLEVHFHMENSGAILTWNYFFNTTPPLLFQHVEDRDIWKFELPNTNDIMSAVISYPMEFPLWESWLNNKKSLENLILEGKVLNRERSKLIYKYKKRARIGEIANYTVPVVNAPSSIASDLLQDLSAGKPFAASYEDREDKRIWQLRSSGEEGLDVSEIATLYGGGGHKRASGFTTKVENINIKLP